MCKITKEQLEKSLEEMKSGDTIPWKDAKKQLDEADERAFPEDDSEFPNPLKD